MTKPIRQSVEFAASPEALYELYMDAKKHSQATGSRATVKRKAGATFTAFDGMLRGKNLLIVPGRMIVQAWRSTSWKKTDPDSILILMFSKTKAGARVDLLHVGVPQHDHKGVTRGWPKYYWKPWRAYLKARR